MSEILVAFPGIGIDSFAIDRAAISIGDFKIYWYGIILTTGIVLAFAYTAFRGKYEGVLFDDVLTIGLWAVILGIVGARTYYVLTSLDKFVPEPFDLWEFLKAAVNLRQGGIAMYGSIIGGVIGAAIATRIARVNLLKFLDMVAPGVMIGQVLGRWGNFFNGEAYGRLVEEGSPLYFIRMGLVSNNTWYDFRTRDMVYVHPTFLYESLWNLAGVLVINALYKKKKFNGQVFCMYLCWYGFGRMFIEGLRTDSLYVGPFRISQLVGAVCFVVCGGILIAGLIFSRKLEGKTELSRFEKMLVPSIIENPVFFEKKKATHKMPENASRTEETAEEAKKEENTVREENENGTDN